MRSLGRRKLIEAGAMAMLAFAAEPTRAGARSDGLFKAFPTNPFATHLAVSTIVTSDIEASVGFYRDLLGYELTRRGRVAGRANGPLDLEAENRSYALFVPRQATGRGGIRLLEAPSNAVANRPRPGATILDEGLGGLECLTSNVDESFRRVTEGGARTVSPPQFYHQDGVKPLPGAAVEWDTGDLEVRTYGVWGPGGELLLINEGITQLGKPWPAWTEPGLHAGLETCVLLTRYRWSAFRFYNRIFGLEPTKDQYLRQTTVNTTIGAPAETYYHFGGLGQGVGFEWWEYPAYRPSAKPPFPTSLNRTGLAMITLVVDDLSRVRRRADEAGVAAVTLGALPTATALQQDAFYLRGALGELIEVVGPDG